MKAIIIRPEISSLDLINSIKVLKSIAQKEMEEIKFERRKGSDIL